MFKNKSNENLFSVFIIHKNKGIKGNKLFSILLDLIFNKENRNEIFAIFL